MHIFSLKVVYFLDKSLNEIEMFKMFVRRAIDVGAHKERATNKTPLHFRARFAPGTHAEGASGGFGLPGQF